VESAGIPAQYDHHARGVRAPLRALLSTLFFCFLLMSF
jgi:hypothetical protein